MCFIGFEPWKFLTTWKLSPLSWFQLNYSSLYFSVHFIKIRAYIGYNLDISYQKRRIWWVLCIPRVEVFKFLTSQMIMSPCSHPLKDLDTPRLGFSTSCMGFQVSRIIYTLATGPIFWCCCCLVKMKSRPLPCLGAEIYISCGRATITSQKILF